MRHFVYLLIMAWGCWAYAQPSLLPTFEKEYKQQLLDQLTKDQASQPPLEEALPCPSCPKEDNMLPAPFTPLTALRGAEIELRDSTVCYGYDPYAQEWMLSSKAVYFYNEDHQEAEYIGYTWQDGWKFNYHYTQSYTGSGFVAESVFQQWGDTDWENQYRYQYTYNEAELRTESLNQLWEDSLGGWQDNSRHLYSYDEQGRLEEDFFLYDQNYPSGTLTPLNKSIYEYTDSEDPVSVTVYRLPDPATEEWVLSSRTLYDYYAPGTVLEALRQLWTGFEWRDNQRTYYVFDENGYRIEWGRQFWQGAGTWLNYFRYLYENDAVGNVLKETHQRWNGFTEDWQNFQQFAYTYDERNRDTESYIWNWGATAYTWQSDYVGIVQYDEAGNELEVLIQYWDEEAGALVNSYRSITAYDGQDNLLSLTLQYWRDGSWLNEERTTYEYNEEGQAVRTLQFYGDEYTTMWILYAEILSEYQNGVLSQETILNIEENGDTVYLGRQLYTYNESDSLTEVLNQFLEPDTEEWTNTWRSLLTYNTIGLRSDSLRQRWLGNDWGNYFQVVYTYDAAGHLTEQLQQDWLYSENGWKNKYLDTWAYNDNGLMIEHIRVQWQPYSTEPRWEYQYRELLTYDGSGREATYIYQIWDETYGYGYWQYRYRYFNVYDEAAGLLLERTFEEYSTLNNNWELYGRWLNEYNEQGLLTFLDAQLATPTEYGWLEGSHCQSYWRTIVPATETAVPKIRCICANPYTPNSPITFQGLDANRRYELRLTGQWGRILYREVLKGDATFSLRSGLPPGFYVLSLHNTKGLIYRQKLIIQ